LTRTRHPFNGIRWAFAYAEDFKDDGSVVAVSDVWPEFIESNGNAIAEDIPLSGILNARMHIVFPEMMPTHMKRIKVGTRFYCMEGDRKCAEGVVTTIRSKTE